MTCSYTRDEVFDLVPMRPYLDGIVRPRLKLIDSWSYRSQASMSSNTDFLANLALCGGLRHVTLSSQLFFGGLLSSHQSMCIDIFCQSNVGKKKSEHVHGHIDFDFLFLEA